jgi:hypothetical protein
MSTSLQGSILRPPAARTLRVRWPATTVAAGAFDVHLWTENPVSDSGLLAAIDATMASMLFAYMKAQSAESFATEACGWKPQGRVGKAFALGLLRVRAVTNRLCRRRCRRDITGKRFQSSKSRLRVLTGCSRTTAYRGLADAMAVRAIRWVRPETNLLM